MSAKYRIQLWSADIASSGGGGFDTLVHEFENAKELGWAYYLNDVGEAFFTLNQSDPKIDGLRSYMPHGHVVYLRDDEVVWRGYLAEYEARSDDVVFYAYSYAGKLFTLQTGWNQTWTDTEVGDIASALWTRAKSDITYSPLGFVTTGTIQDPVTTSGGSTAIVLPSYKAFYKRILFAFRELTAIATSDTSNVCYFELAHTSDPTDHDITFDLWKDRTTDRTAIRWEYGAQIRDFVDRHAPILGRNDLFGVGSGAHNLLFRSRQQQSTGTYGYETIGRHQEPIYLAWVRDEDDLERVTKLRAKKALRSDVDLILLAHGDAIEPIGTTNAGHALGDRVKVKIDRGVTQIDKYMFILGEQVRVSRGVEHVRPLLADRTA